MEEKTKLKFSIPWAVSSIVLIQFFIFLWQSQAARFGVEGHVINEFSFNWTQFLENPPSEFPTLITHTFLHSDITHIISNIIFFLLFAPAIERVLGPFFFVMAYGVWGLIAGILNGYFSPFVSLLGASGAISGAAGAYFVLYPIRLRSFLPFIYLGAWFLFNLKMGFIQVNPTGLEGESTGQVGYLAHIGGFACGALTVAPAIFKNTSRNQSKNNII